MSEFTYRVLYRAPQLVQKDTWSFIGEWTARSAEEAIKMAAGSDSGDYVAIAQRFWVQRNVRTETVVEVHLSEPKVEPKTVSEAIASMAVKEDVPSAA